MSTSDVRASGSEFQSSTISTAPTAPTAPINTMQQAGADPTQMPGEEVLEVDDIQGNILAGFNKDFQTFLFIKIHDRAITRDWLRSLTPCIASTAEVLLFNRLYRSLRSRRQQNPHGMVATWVNIAFTYEGIQKLTSEAEANKFQDTSFRLGLSKRSGILGDPVDPHSDGHPNQWVVGGSKNVADILLIIASDDPTYLAAEVKHLKSDIQALSTPTNGKSGENALEITYEQAAAARSDIPGHEHFGFKDGISQPGMRGRVSAAAQDFLTPRLIAPQDPSASEFARPGQPLIWPGQVVLGYKRQKADDFLEPLPALELALPWTRNGSFLVVRRLRQDVPAFWRFIRDQAARLAQIPAFAGMTPERFGALLVGRWPSGAPLMRSLLTDNPALAQDDFANNHFLYVAPTAPLPLIEIPSYPGDTFPQAKGDESGAYCPRAAHIRKVNPRDMATDTGGARDTRIHLVIRRGIAFGQPVKDPIHPTTKELKEERGLMFLCYQASIENQFEFLINHWANADKQPRPGGHDPIIGQHRDQEGNRIRQLEIQGNDGSTEVINIPLEWVTPTGGGYFFAPSLSALKTVLSAQ
ncbi:MAG: Dyp-type peroxidase [Ktedonobacteraceae bacterium]